MEVNLAGSGVELSLLELSTTRNSVVEVDIVVTVVDVEVISIVLIDGFVLGDNSLNEGIAVVEVNVLVEDVVVEAMNSRVRVDCVDADCSLCSEVVLTTTSFFFTFSVVSISSGVIVVVPKVEPPTVEPLTVVPAVEVEVDVVVDVVFDVVVDVVLDVEVDVKVDVVVVVLLDVVVDVEVVVVVDVEVNVVVVVLLDVVDFLVDVLVDVVVVGMVDVIVLVEESLSGTEVASKLGILVAGVASGSLKYPRLFKHCIRHE